METLTSAPKDATLPYDREGWRSGYRSLTEEYDYPIEEIEGEIPAELCGTLFRNGPARFERGDQRCQHPFDGDGMICSFTFKDGNAHFRNRYVRTAGFVEEEAADKFLYRGAFGSQKPGGWLANAFDFRLKNIANTNVIYWGGKLLALWEAAEPHRLDPHTLETKGLDYLDGILKPGGAFAAHPWVDPGNETEAPRLVNFSTKPGLSTKITVYELDEAGKLLLEHSHAVPGFAFMHDFAITPSACIFFQAPMQFNPIPFALGFKGPGECIDFQLEKPTQIIVIPRDGGPAEIFPMDSGFVFHHANAFEEGDEIVVDSICYAFFPTLEAGQDFLDVDFDALAPGQLWRSRINRKTGQVTRTLIEERCCEFPFVHPQRVGQPYRMLYMGAAHEPTGNAPLQAILKRDMETGDCQLWSAAPWGYISEPIFVPFPGKTGEEEGWLLTLVHNGQTQRGELVILDARDIREPVARLKLRNHVPYGLHGSFTPEYFG
ncbi:MAG: carotenoid oxygenase family protein [Cyanobacteria bacterium J06638_22]